MSLEEQISERSREIQTDGYAMSIGEVVSMYREGDLDIHPEFQRIFRWKLEKKSRLIESILLGIPIPPIFVSQRPDGIWDVIDGVQRLSTIFEFMGEYRDEAGALITPSELVGTDYLPDLNAVSWEEGGAAFSGALRRDFKRAKLEFRIIKKGSDENAKYDLFERLNSGAILSQQESRNCLLVMLNDRMFTEISELASDGGFVNCVSLSDRQEEQAYRQELVLRFFCQSAYAGGTAELGKEYGEYLTAWMREVAPKYGTSEGVVNSNMFRSTFQLLQDTVGEDAFRRWNGEKHLGPFSIAAYEFVTSGVSANLAGWQAKPEALVDRVRSIWQANEFRSNSGTGVSPRRRVPRLIVLSRTYFDPGTA